MSMCLLRLPFWPKTLQIIAINPQWLGNYVNKIKINHIACDVTSKYNTNSTLVVQVATKDWFSLL